MQLQLLLHAVGHEQSVSASSRRRRLGQRSYEQPDEMTGEIGGRLRQIVGIHGFVSFLGTPTTGSDTDLITGVRLSTCPKITCKRHSRGGEDCPP
jgi:hypothetical protein